MASSCASEPSLALEARDFGHAYAGAARASLAGVDLAVAPGECVWLRGASGSGKSTLLRGLAGVLPPGGVTRGSVRSSERPALLFQDVDCQLLCSTVGEEVELALRERGVSAAERRTRAREALLRVGLAGFERRSVDALSAGEKQRVILAALLALRPRVLLLDEPASALDPEGRRRLSGLLQELKAQGHALVVADHTPDIAAAVADRHVDLDRDRPPTSPDASIAGSPPPPASAEVLRAEDLSVVDASGRALLAGVSLRVRRGERVLLTGRNGAGKTTLLRAVAGCLPVARGSCVAEPATRGSGGFGLLAQDPHRHLFARTVADEIAFALRRRGLARREIEARVAEATERCGLTLLRDRSPLRLSLGEQIRTALAAVLAPRPGLLLLDEPFAGLDAPARDRLAQVLADEQARTGAALVVASHDPRPWRRWSSRTLHLAAGSLADA